MTFCRYETLYLVPFARYSASKIPVSDFGFSGSPDGQIFRLFLGLPIWDFILTFYWYELYISSPFARYSASQISVSDLDLSRVIEGQLFHLSWETDIGLYNGLLLIRILYLVPFGRYSASKIQIGDLDLSGLPKVKYFYFFRKPMCHFIMTCSVDTNSISRTVREIFRI